MACSCGRSAQSTGSRCNFSNPPVTSRSSAAPCSRASWTSYPGLGALRVRTHDSCQECAQCPCAPRTGRRAPVPVPTPPTGAMTLADAFDAAIARQSAWWREPTRSFTSCSKCVGVGAWVTDAELSEVLTCMGIGPKYSRFPRRSKREQTAPTRHACAGLYIYAETRERRERELGGRGGVGLGGLSRHKPK